MSLVLFEGDGARWKCLFLRVIRRILILRFSYCFISCLNLNMRFNMPTSSPALLNVARDLISILSGGSRRPAVVVLINGIL